MMDEDTALSFSRDPPLMEGAKEGEGGKERAKRGEDNKLDMCDLQVILITGSKGSFSL